jgi:hypothetical protein
MKKVAKDSRSAEKYSKPGLTKHEAQMLNTDPRQQILRCSELTGQAKWLGKTFEFFSGDDRLLCQPEHKMSLIKVCRSLPQSL